MIRPVLSQHKETIPTVIEIPSKDKPYGLRAGIEWIGLMRVVIVLLAGLARCWDRKICKGMALSFCLFVVESAFYPFQILSSMARLVLFGVRTYIGDDDVGFVMVYHGILRIVMLICLIVAASSCSSIEDWILLKWRWSDRVNARGSFILFFVVHFLLTAAMLAVALRWVDSR